MIPIENILANNSVFAKIFEFQVYEDIRVLSLNFCLTYPYEILTTNVNHGLCSSLMKRFLLYIPYKGN